MCIFVEDPYKIYAGQYDGIYKRDRQRFGNDALLFVKKALSDAQLPSSSSGTNVRPDNLISKGKDAHSALGGKV